MTRRGSYRRVQELSALPRVAMAVALPEEGERPPLEAGTRVLVKGQQTRKTQCVQG
jgi:hypothetical protein